MTNTHDDHLSITTTHLCTQTVVVVGLNVIIKEVIACEQALHLGDNLKYRRARGTREETRKEEERERKESLLAG